MTGDNATATAAVDDPAPPGAEIGAGGYSVWYSWTAPGTGPVRFDTESTSTGRDTTLAAYRGSRGALALVAGNDDRPGGGLLSTIEFRATAGETYLLAVDGFATATGSGPFDLVWQEAAAPPEAPTGVAAVRGDQRATVSWTAAQANGSPVTGYTVTAAPGGRTATVAGGLHLGSGQRADQRHRLPVHRDRDQRCRHLGGEHPVDPGDARGCPDPGHGRVRGPRRWTREHHLVPGRRQRHARHGVHRHCHPGWAQHHRGR